jgi:hypothetical protein
LLRRPQVFGALFERGPLVEKVLQALACRRQRGSFCFEFEDFSHFVSTFVKRRRHYSDPAM